MALASKARRLQELLGSNPSLERIGIGGEKEHQHYLYVMIEMSSVAFMTLKFECKSLSSMVAQWFGTGT